MAGVRDALGLIFNSPIAVIARDQPELGPPGQGRTCAQHVEAPCLDPIEDGQAPPRKEVDIDSERPRNSRDQRSALLKKSAGPIDLELHQARECRRESQLSQFRLGIAKSHSIFTRQVDAANFQVAGDVLPEVGQLQRGAGRVGKPSVLGREGAGE